MARRSIKSIITKPSEALQAMVDGLRKQSQRPDFRIDMATYGDKAKDEEDISKGILCFGCAATCTVQEIAGKDLDCEIIGNRYLRSVALGLRQAEEREFEFAINSARLGDSEPLFRFFGMMTRNIPYSLLHGRYSLGTTDWKKKLPKVKKHIATLQKKGY